jgi:hypothetical protein
VPHVRNATRTGAKGKPDPAACVMWCMDISMPSMVAADASFASKRSGTPMQICYLIFYVVAQSE